MITGGDLISITEMIKRAGEKKIARKIYTGK